ncbi:hypothetical protein Amet_1028 [Alkaliphilus metalliredigens QYMF]|uniref:Uncharacterized protein n=1 Tax=Alkaliphilus metalliredigens (strain QYMF) TaxID=293826 RepID=A6TM27_ALKMQ|nr:hypothetical protein [Alkaliphilus metalliredigens]ABR47245.1 hypothetical protein Amet_1028 [Alkaliphilus metalliredigens QYMF]
MFSPDQLNELIKEVMINQQMGSNDNPNQNKHKYKHEEQQNKSQFNITPSQALVVLGLLTGALQVVSVLVDREQSVQLVLSGSLKKKEQSELEKVMGQIGHLPFDEVVKAMMGRLK